MARQTEIGSMLSELEASGELDGMTPAEIGEMVAARMNQTRGQRHIKTAGVSSGLARSLALPLSRVQALAAGSSANMTGTPTRDGVLGRLTMFSSAHDDVSITDIQVMGRPQAVGVPSAPMPITRFYRDSYDTIPISWDSLIAAQSVVLTVKNEHAATATNIMGGFDYETVS